MRLDVSGAVGAVSLTLSALWADQVTLDSSLDADLASFAFGDTDHIQESCVKDILFIPTWNKLWKPVVSPCWLRISVEGSFNRELRSLCRTVDPLSPPLREECDVGVQEVRNGKGRSLCG